MLKFNFILILLFSFCPFSFATEHDSHTQTLFSEPNIRTLKIIEHTNLDTQNYIWQFELTLNTQEKTITYTLLNPSPKWTVLNQRASELAQNYTYAKLENLNQSENKNANNDPTIQSLPVYHLNIRFPQGIAWKKQPRFQRLADASARLCKLQPNDANYESAVIHKNRSYTFNTQLYMHANGQVNYVDLLNPSSNPQLNQLIYKELISSQFQPFNENGVPASFKAEQPILLVCPD